MNRLRSVVFVALLAAIAATLGLPGVASASTCTSTAPAPLGGIACPPVDSTAVAVTFDNVYLVGPTPGCGYAGFIATNATGGGVTGYPAYTVTATTAATTSTPQTWSGNVNSSGRASVYYCPPSGVPVAVTFTATVQAATGVAVRQWDSSLCTDADCYPVPDPCGSTCNVVDIPDPIDFISDTYGQQPAANTVGLYAALVMQAREDLGIPNQLQDLSNAQQDAVSDLVDQLILDTAESLTDPYVDYGNALLDSLLYGVPEGAVRGPYDEMNDEEKKVCKNNPFDCWRSRDTARHAFEWSAQVFPEYGGHNDKRDAHRHCVWSALMAKRANSEFARQFGFAHERGAKNQPIREFNMDVYNNSKGREVGRDGENEEDRWIAMRCKFWANQGILQNSP